jgi:hypothetical protein
MSTESNPTEYKERKRSVHYRGASSEAVYGLGLIGAWVYYIGHATTFLQGVIGFFKGLVWPGFMVYELLHFLYK